MIVTLIVNGTVRQGEIAGSESLLRLLRDDLRLTGAKNACEEGECGSCSVILDGELVCACLVMALDVAGSTVVTVEGEAGGDELHPVQQAFVGTGAAQCGFCTPGFVVAAAHLLQVDPRPSPEDIREALAGNICRCTGYGSILRALSGREAP